MSTSPVAQVRQDDFTSEKATFGGVTVITMHGTLNEGFEGRKLAAAIRSSKILVHMHDVKRFASWGMSEWMDFLRGTDDREVYLVECSTYAVSQLNLVTGLLGNAKLVSFYASYRCTRCNEEMKTRFLIPRDRALIPDIPNSYQDCPTCGGRARLEEYPAAFFDTIAMRPPYDIDDEVLSFMRSRLNYDLSPDLTRFRAYRKVQGPYTYIRLTGNIATMVPDVLARATGDTTTVIDADGVVCEPSQVAPWHAFVTTVAPKLKSLQLLACPISFLESAVRVEDLRANVKVRSFNTTLQCGVCETVTAYTVDVAANLEELAQGIVPPGRCSSCRASLVLTPSEALATVLRALPARDRDAALDAFLAKARAEPTEKLENCLTIAPPAPPSAPHRRTYVAAIVGVLLLGSAGVVTWQRLKLHSAQPEATPEPAVQPSQPLPPPGPTFTRPDWIISDVPASGYCHDMINRLMCVGVSSFRSSREDGVAEANDAALEELVNTIGLKVSQQYFRDVVMTGYSPARIKAIHALQTAGLNRTSNAKAHAAYVEAADAIRGVRKRLVSILQATGGAAVPTQRADWYWEEYAPESGSESEFLVFVRYDVSLDSVRALVDKYSAVTDVLDAHTMTAYPELAWQYASFDGGVLVSSVGTGRLAKAGVATQDIVTAVADQRVVDANAFARQVEDKHDLKLTISSGDQPPKTVSVAK